MSEVPLHIAAEDLSLNGSESLNQQSSSQTDACTHDGVLSLPNEILLRILATLKDKELYRQIKTCRAFHDVSLHILFNRQFNQIPSGQIRLHNSPQYILPAIHGALFLHDLHDISILFNSDKYKFFTEMRILTEIIQRMKRNTRLSLDMRRVGALGSCLFLEHLLNEYKELAKALQGLVDLALKKGCTRLHVSSGDAFKDGLYAMPTAQEARPSSSTAVSASNISNSVIPIFPSHSVVLFPPNKKRASIILSSPPLFSSFFLDWTLSLLNYGNFAKIEFFTSRFEYNIGHDILPKIRMDELREIFFDGESIDLYDLALFLQRHSGSLNAISLNLSRDVFPTSWTVRSSLSHFSDHPNPPVRPLYLDFPVLRHLILTSYHIPWFLDGIMSNPNTTQYLPNLSSLTIKLFPDRPEVPCLDRVLESVLKLVNLEIPGHRCPDWLSCLRLNAKGIKATSFLTSLDSYTTKHCTTGSSSKPNLARIFPHVQDLHVEFRYMAIDLDIFTPIRRFLAFFPNVKRFEMGSVSREAVKQRGGVYWQETRVHCPRLEEVVFEELADLPAKMDDLVRGVYPFY
ncbi:hypothetical protein BDN72DRAFT_937844 [Pluteus cervinus]|uniref:Uncharacterized protein n=1 Tax=Pluteus cervinus TaxID=181527 RepID=A0ACD3B109_9AGAR|nr:hypothetical protein BDN72DRAFT_937844 [Pluteus cervinus]